MDDWTKAPQKLYIRDISQITFTSALKFIKGSTLKWCVFGYDVLACLTLNICFESGSIKNFVDCYFKFRISPHQANHKCGQ